MKVLRTLPPLLVSAVLLAAEPGADPSQVRHRLSAVQARLAQVDQQLAALKKRRKGVLVELQDISLQAERVRAQAEGARIQRDQAQMEVQRITRRKEDIQKDMARLRVELRKQVRWMQAVGPFAGLGVVSSESDVKGFLERGRYLAYWRSQQRKRLNAVQTLQGELTVREAELKAALSRLAQEEQAAAQLQASLRLNEGRLQAFLDGLSQDERRQQAVQSELAEEALQLERMLGQLADRARADVFQSSVAFSALRGLLPRPVEGSLAQGFGERLHPKFRTRTVNSGLLIATGSGAPVTAVAEGRVVFADLYQSYGPMVILDHGGGYFSLYTHLRLFQVSKGQVLAPGEPLGQAGDTLDGSRLGFEVRLQATPQDPQTWLRQRYR